jgi:hypothetical protein
VLFNSYRFVFLFLPVALLGFFLIVLVSVIAMLLFG